MTGSDGNLGEDAAQRLRATLDSLLDPHVVMTAVRDDSGRIIDLEYTDANSAACAYNGMTHEELMGRRLLEFLPAHLHTGMFDRIVELIETGHPLVIDDFVYPVELLGGQERHFDIRGVPLGDSMVYTWRDVTERHEQIEALERAEREYRSLAEATTDMVYRTDSDGIIQWVSPSVRRVLGWEPADLIGRSARHFSDPQEWSGYEQTRADIYAGDLAAKGHEAVIFHIRSRDGARVPVTSYLAQDLDAAGNWTGGLLVGLRDVSEVLREQQNADRERARAARLELSMDRAAIGMAITDLAGVFEYVNPALTKMLGYRQEELVGRALRDVTHPEDHDASDALLQRLAADGDVESLAIRRRYVNSSGDTIWVDLAVGAARAEDGSIDHLVVQVVEVTPEVEYADALEKTVRRFRYLAENASDLVYEMDADWHIRWISPSVQNVLGWRPDSLVGTVARQLFAPGQEELLDIRGEQMRAGFSVGGEVLAYLTASGQHKYMSGMANPIVEPDGTVTGVVVGLRDVTSEIETREDLARVQARLRLAVDAAPGGLAITDAAGVLVDVNREFCRLVGRGEQEVLGLALLSILGAAESGVCPAGDRHEHPRLDRGVQRWLEHAVSEVTSASPSAQAYQVHLFSDITRERELREELRHLANHDVLTGVANRRRIVERLQEVALAPERPDRRIGVLFCDIDTVDFRTLVFGYAA